MQPTKSKSSPLCSQLASGANTLLPKTFQMALNSSIPWVN